jgi:acyl-CoA synthetase (AMP-forming)/AMP-acid ligase II
LAGPLESLVGGSRRATERAVRRGLEAARVTPRAGARALTAVLQHPATALEVGIGTVLSGVVPALRPDLILRQLEALRREGPTLAGAVAAAAALAGDAPAIIDDSGTRTWGELDGRGRRLAAAFADLGVCPGDRVGVLCRNHAEFVETLVALATLGADAVLLNTGSGPGQLARILAAQRVRVLIADADLELVAPPPGAITVTAWHDGSAAGRTVGALIEQTRPDRRTARPPRPGRLIVLTSGTTGTPKDAARPTPSTAAGLLAVAVLLGRLPLRCGAPTAIPAPLFHAWGLGALQLAVATRAPIVLARTFDAETLATRLAAHQVEQLFVVPVMLTRLLALPTVARGTHDLRALRLIVSSGSALPPATVRATTARFGKVLHNLYGSTEVSWVSVAGPADLARDPGTAGRPPLGTRLAILDRDGMPRPDGTSGRIFVGSSMPFDGYAEAATTTPDGLMATGDLGHLDSDGMLRVDGREDDLVVCGGENIFCREVADVLADVPGILDVAVVGVPDPEFGQRLAAFVVTAPGATLTAEDVRAIVREHLARHAIPRDVSFLTELPRNAAGKVLSRVLREGKS